MRRAGRLLAAVLLIAALSGCDAMQRISEGAYRNAVSDGTTDELRARGVELEHRPDCALAETGSDALVRVHCKARTRTGEPVTVRGVAHDADTPRPREQYVVTVGEREIFRTDCLGPDCD
ncbi:hypothetical protein BJF79_07795 [Actinomadura sp. CNU-125]|uniref:hypothetical protein n=1 Tax=Actinomadura sp. CNU-125 TaxID=1904961 RepID=UPI00095F8556|nr:hypothetical protein [Actinomadura sp. CNU-125]OLT33791.1 hypothetical protein BJF79_07795 [Actinomadura sp. CNU-125]